MITKKQNYIFLVCLSFIFLVGLTIRFYHIDKIPQSLYWDEVASTYNAYSIAKTGRDEYGISFPLLFRSFSDYKASGNIYLTAVATQVFGLSEFSARFTSSFAGSLTVIITFFLIKELIGFMPKNQINIGNRTFILIKEKLGLLTAGMLAISPWHIQFSRTGFEANVAVLFTMIGAWLLFRSIRTKHQWTYYLAMTFFALDFYFYRSIWVFLPLFLGFTFFFARSEFFTKKMFRVTVIGIIIFFLILVPFIPVMISKEGMVRAQQVNIFVNSEENIAQAAQARLQTPINKIFYNQRLVFPKIIFTNYFAHISPQFLFLTGDPNGRHGPRGMGLLYLWEIPFLLIGLYIVIVKFSSFTRNIILIWILVAPLPAIFSTPSPHALRDLNILPMPQLLTALGLYVAFYFVNKQWRTVYIGTISVVVTCFFIHYIYLYYVFTPKITASDWADGYKQLAQFMIPREKEYEKLVVSAHYWKPYIYFLFYKKYDPLLFQTTGNEFGFDKYIFSGTRWGKNEHELDNIDLQQFAHARHILVAMSPQEYETQKKSLRYLSTIKNSNNEIVFIVGDMK